MMICKQTNVGWSLVWLVVSWVWQASAAGNRAILTVIDFAPWSYACMISDYGNSLDRSRMYLGNMMIPPGDPQLCEFPEEITDVLDNMTLPVVSQAPIALLVNLGGCDIHTKASVALEINAEVENSIGYVIFYNNDADRFDEIVPLVRPGSGSNITLPENLESIGFLSVSTGAGTSLMGRIQRYSRVTGKNPEFLSDGNAGWNLPMVLERFTGQSSAGRCTNCNNSTRVEGNFYWFRLVLFALLIISPCCRAGYLWWAGGGRIQFRRNENGRITGIQYIPPISYWFASNGAQEAHAPVTDRLTEEQVLALPEIIYKASEDDSENEDDLKNDDSAVLEDVDIVVNAGTEDETPLQVKEKVLKTADEEQPPMLSNYTTTCTTCSICIEEFENGERIRVLPRCRHAFHYECIKPWLTERQGCCPLCKTSVIEQDGGEGDSNEDTVDVEPTNSHVETATELESENDVSVSRSETAFPYVGDRSPESDLATNEPVHFRGLIAEDNTETNEESALQSTTSAETDMLEDKVPSYDSQGVRIGSLAVNDDAEAESAPEVAASSGAKDAVPNRAETGAPSSIFVKERQEGQSDAVNCNVPVAVSDDAFSEESVTGEEISEIPAPIDVEENAIETSNSSRGEPK